MKKILGKCSEWPNLCYCLLLGQAGDLRDEEDSMFFAIGGVSGGGTQL